MVARRRRHGTLCPAVLSRLLHSVPGPQEGNRRRWLVAAAVAGSTSPSASAALQGGSPGGATFAAATAAAVAKSAWPFRWMARGPTGSRCVHSRPLGPGARPQTPSGFDRRGDAAACQQNAARCPVTWALAHDPAVAHSLRGTWAAGLRPPRQAHPRGCGAAGGASLCTRTRGAPSTPPALVGWALSLGARLVAPVLCWKPAHPFSLPGALAGARRRLTDWRTDLPPMNVDGPHPGWGASAAIGLSPRERERERQTDRQSVSLSLSLSLNVSLCVPLSLSLCLPVCVSVCVSVSLCLSWSPSVPPSVSPVSLFVSLVE